MSRDSYQTRLFLDLASQGLSPAQMLDRIQTLQNEASVRKRQAGRELVHLGDLRRRIKREMEKETNDAER